MSEATLAVAAELDDAIVNAWRAEGDCVRSVADARVLLQQVIDDVGAEGWAISVEQNVSPGVHCAGAGVNPGARELSIYPTDPPDSPD